MAGSQRSYRHNKANVSQGLQIPLSLDVETEYGAAFAQCAMRKKAKSRKTMISLKPFAKRLLESERSKVASRGREILFMRQARGDSKFSEKVGNALKRQQMNVQSPDLLRKNGDTLFILAGGSSVNQISESQFKIIKSETSIGINLWPIHSFIPTALSTESGHVPGPSNQFISRRINQYSSEGGEMPQILILRPPWPPEQSWLYKTPVQHRSEEFIYGRVNLITRNEENLDADLLKVIEKTANHELPSNVLPDNGSSVVRLTFLAIARGYKNIVWVGVDQDDGPYFWTQSPIPEHYSEAAKLFPRTPGEPHSTSSAEKRPLPNDIFLRKLAQNIPLASKSRIFVANPGSNLTDELPIFDWKSKAE